MHTPQLPRPVLPRPSNHQPALSRRNRRSPGGRTNSDEDRPRGASCVERFSLPSDGRLSPHVSADGVVLSIRCCRPLSKILEGTNITLIGYPPPPPDMTTKTKVTEHLGHLAELTCACICAPLSTACFCTTYWAPSRLPPCPCPGSVPNTSCSTAVTFESGRSKFPFVVKKKRPFLSRWRTSRQASTCGICSWFRRAGTSRADRQGFAADHACLVMSIFSACHHCIQSSRV